MLDDVFVFGVKPTPVREAGDTLDATVHNFLSSGVREVFPHFHQAPVRPAEPGPGPGEIQEQTEPFGEEVVEPGDLLQPAVVATSAELNSWLDAIRARIEGLLSSGKRVCIKG